LQQVVEEVRPQLDGNCSLITVIVEEGVVEGFVMAILEDLICYALLALGRELLTKQMNFVQVCCSFHSH
jgi:hypothetical protein